MLAAVVLVLALVTRQPRWVWVSAIACAVVAATAFVSYWYLWGKAFNYADTNRPVPPSLDQASNITMAVCLLSCLVGAALGASRLLAAWNARPKSG